MIVKEPAGLSRDDGKHPDDVTLLPWAKGKPLAWDVTVPDTYADSHLADTTTTAGAAADKAASNKVAKYTRRIRSRLAPPRQVWGVRVRRTRQFAPTPVQSVLQ